MNKLFEKSNINGLSLANRFIFSATWDGNADDNGFCTQRNIDMLVERARGGVGLIITGMAYVQADGRAAPWQLAVHGDEFVPGLTEMTKTVHDTQTKVILQLAHGGCYAPTALTGQEVAGPSVNDSDRSCKGFCVNGFSVFIDQAFCLQKLWRIGSMPISSV